MQGWTSHKNLEESIEFIEKYFLNTRNTAIHLNGNRAAIDGMEIVYNIPIYRDILF